MIEFRQVSLTLGDFALREVSLRIKKGDYYFIIGPSGAGKTVILEAIAGLHLPDRGEIFIEGRDVSAVPPEKRRIALVYQDYSLFPHMKVEANIGFSLMLQRRPKEDIQKRVAELLEKFGIAQIKHRFPGTLSGGEQQRVAIARALASEPDILLLDEPFASLDPLTREQILNDIKRIHRENGITIVQVTHAREEILRMATGCAVIIDGVCIQEGAVDQVFQAPESTAVARFVGMENILAGVVAGSADGLAFLDVAGRRITAVSDASRGTAVDVAFRAGDVTLQLEGGDGSTALNRFSATITAVVPLGGPLTEVYLDAGFPIVALVTRRSAEDLDFAPGMSVSASIKASAIRIIPKVG
ncbi:molybdenum transport atp-binding protein modc [hydrocarbon metagenome]|uniref:Molybdenum transport atp-binding protein modc n=1 Tax=hydrocarbon metagenome TaxID=938273 RepID=A0A0W8FFA6_9ZZZZ|nr:ABC transporter ATP-binding protein [Methanomicrobiaceae archaeon]